MRECCAAVAITLSNGGDAAAGPSAFEFYAFEDTAWTRQMSGIKGSGPATKDWAAAQAYANEQNTKVAKHQVAAISFAKVRRSIQRRSVATVLSLEHCKHSSDRCSVLVFGCITRPVTPLSVV